MNTFDTIEEATIEAVHRAFSDGTLTARQLVQSYLDRIEAVDRSGPQLNSVLTISPKALSDADELDRIHRETGRLIGPLHGVPILVKDQAETSGIVTTFGSNELRHYVPDNDATAIARLRAAGAIILGKTTMPDFATSWFSTSSASGVTKNPYDVGRDPGGSSSGTGAAIAANLALVGIGEDTGGSIRVPASFCNLVGVRVTPGMISRAGMSPLVVPQDTAGPMTRTVTDAARLLDVLVGYDPADPYTSAVGIARPGSFLEAVKNASLEGKRIGVLRQAFAGETDPEGPHVDHVINEALERLREAGAQLIDIEIPQLMERVGFTSLYYTCSREEIDEFLAGRPALGLPSVAELRRTGRYHPLLDLFEGIADGPAKAKDDPSYLDRVLAREDFARDVASIFLDKRLDGVVFPDVRLPAPSHEDIFGGRWTCLTYPTNTVIASQLRFPAVTVPAGFTAEGLPVGIEVMSLPYSDSSLLELARGIEKATRARRAPVFQAAG